jgi:hypothetical protein
MREADVVCVKKVPYALSAKAPGLAVLQQRPRNQPLSLQLARIPPLVSLTRRSPEVVALLLGHGTPDVDAPGAPGEPLPKDYRKPFSALCLCPAVMARLSHACLLLVSGERDL